MLNNKYYLDNRYSHEHLTGGIEIGSPPVNKVSGKMFCTE
jgi:hypothetical protein